MHRNIILEKDLVNTRSTVSLLPLDQGKRKKEPQYKSSFTVKEQSLADLNAQSKQATQKAKEEHYKKPKPKVFKEQSLAAVKSKKKVIEEEKEERKEKPP